MKIFIKTLSPVHIGSGKVLEPFDYLFHQQKIILLDHAACLDQIYESSPEGIERYSDWVNQTSLKIANAKREHDQARRNRDRQGSKQYNQVLADLRRNFNIIHFCKNILKDAQLADAFLNQSAFHKLTMPALGKPKNTLQLREMLHLNGQPYLPGSSLKGALRTALAYRVLKTLAGEPLNILLNGKTGTNIKGIGDVLKKIRALSGQTIAAIEQGDFRATEEAFRALAGERRRWEKKIGAEVEKVIFGCGEAGKLGEKYDDPKFDLLRLIKISDSFEAQIELLAGHLMSFTRDGLTGQLKSQPVQFCQFIDAGSQFTCDVEVDTRLIQIIQSQQVKGWLGFAEKFRQLFGAAPDSSTPPEALARQVVQQILRAIMEFSQAVIQKEKEWLDEFNIGDLAAIREFYNGLESQKPLLRLGFASGWHGTTIGLALAENPGLSEYLPEIIYAFNLDLIINQEKVLRRAERNQKMVQQQLRLLKRTPNSRRYPRSRRMIAEYDKPHSPVGWLEISLQPFEKSKKQKEELLEESITSEENRNFDDSLTRLREKFKGN